MRVCVCVFGSLHFHVAAFVCELVRFTFVVLQNACAADPTGDAALRPQPRLFEYFRFLCLF